LFHIESRTHEALDNNFYQDYAVAKNKPYMVSETAATFHENSPFGAGVGELETKRSWWRQFITNATFLGSHPNLKLICLFEFQKFEETFADGTPSLRDFRVTNQTEILDAFKTDFNGPSRTFYLFGNVTAPVDASNTTIRTGTSPSPEPKKKKSGASAASWTASLFVTLLISLI
jgi:hypothetical protein